MTTAQLTEKVIQIAGVAGPFECSCEGKYVRAMDFEAYGGRGYLQTTPDKTKAMRFADAGAAMAFWRRPSARVPLRPDGKPNRPLTAYHVIIEDA